MCNADVKTAKDQPVETAPRDGQRIEVFLAGEGVWAVACWAQPDPGVGSCQRSGSVHAATGDALAAGQVALMRGGNVYAQQAALSGKRREKPAPERITAPLHRMSRFG